MLVKRNPADVSLNVRQFCLIPWSDQHVKSTTPGINQIGDGQLKPPQNIPWNQVTDHLEVERPPPQGTGCSFGRDRINEVLNSTDITTDQQSDIWIVAVRLNQEGRDGSCHPAVIIQADVGFIIVGGYRNAPAVLLEDRQDVFQVNIQFIAFQSRQMPN